mgnify:FL=1
MFSSNIKKIMKEKKLTIRQLESETGMSTRTLNKARSNDGISECRLSTIARIADALGVDVKETFERKPAESHEQKY